MHKGLTDKYAETYTQNSPTAHVFGEKILFDHYSVNSFYLKTSTYPPLQTNTSFLWIIMNIRNNLGILTIFQRGNMSPLFKIVWFN